MFFISRTLKGYVFNIFIIPNVIIARLLKNLEKYDLFLSYEEDKIQAYYMN